MGGTVSLEAGLICISCVLMSVGGLRAVGRDLAEENYGAFWFSYQKFCQ
jgi:hypothetical protein